MLWRQGKWSKADRVSARVADQKPKTSGVMGQQWSCHLSSKKEPPKT